MSILSEGYRLLQDLFSPAHCAYCRITLEERVPLCSRCYDRIRPIVSLDLALTTKKSMPIIAMGAYEEPLCSLVRAKHYGNITAAHQLGQLVGSFLADRNFNADYLIPIPLHWSRYAVRGFNQAEIIAQEIGKRYHIPVVNALSRMRYTSYQASCTARTRLDNVHNVFEVAASDVTLYANRHIALVDDLMTTGATLQSAGRALLALRPASISVIVPCRVVL